MISEFHKNKPFVTILMPSNESHCGVTMDKRLSNIFVFVISRLLNFLSNTREKVIKLDLEGT